jgi:broad specificity phosphatase PhoE
LTTRLILVRSGPTSATKSSAFPADEPLDQRALSKLTVAPCWHRADRCRTSPALRALQTAEALHLDATVDPLLRDCDYGRWSGRSFDEIQAQEPEALAEWMRDPAAAPHGGESALAVMERAAAWVDSQNGYSGNVVAVTHATVIRAAIVHALGAGPASLARIDIAPWSMAKLSGHGGRWNLVSLGERPGTAHPSMSMEAINTP